MKTKALTPEALEALFYDLPINVDGLDAEDLEAAHHALTYAIDQLTRLRSIVTVSQYARDARIDGRIAAALNYEAHIDRMVLKLNPFMKGEN